MRAQTLPALAGWQWLTGGFALFRRNPPMLGMLVIAYWLILILLNIVPLLGVVLASMAMPGLSVGLMQAARNLEQRKAIGVDTLIGGLKDNRRTLFALGALYLCCTLGILGLSSLLDGGRLFDFMLAGKPGEPMTEETDANLPLLLVVLLMTPLLMAYWFAPVLAAWHHITLGKSLFFSFVACWLNWRAFVVYGLGVLLVGGILPGLIIAALLMVFPGLASFATTLLLLPMLMIFVPTLFASFYVSYRDIFGVSEIV